MAAPWTQGVRVRLLGRIHGQQTVNVMHFATNTQINDPAQRDALILALLIAVLDCVGQQLLPAVTSDWSCEGAEGIPIAPTPGDPVFKAADPGTVGTLSASSTSFIASLVEIRTGLGGRTHRGRVFLPPAGEAGTNNSLLIQSVMDELINFVACIAGKFMGAGATEPWRIGVLSRKLLAGSPANFDTAFTEATSLVPQQRAAIMGSRKLNRGS